MVECYDNKTVVFCYVDLVFLSFWAVSKTTFGFDTPFKYYFQVGVGFWNLFYIVLKMQPVFSLGMSLFCDWIELNKWTRSVI